jgi:UDP-N-acetylglucosamine 2-epimerase (non-hydrolysing)
VNNTLLPTPELLAQFVNSGDRVVHIIAIATKPDIIKQAPVYQELKSRGANVMICHTGQHYDDNYSGAMLEEFGIEIHAHLAISGALATKTAQIIERFSQVLDVVREAGLTPVPYIHGDTLTSMAVGVSSYLNRVACVHVEAGIRTMTPTGDFYRSVLADHAAGSFSWDEYLAAMRDESTYELGSREPFPEQFNTRVSEAATGFHAAPVELVRGFLLSENFPPETIEVVGNSVVDATRAAVADAERATVFETYPQLASGKFIRFCVHRRENTESAQRFAVLFEALELLVRRGESVLLISLFGTEAAIDEHGFRDRLNALVDEFPETFIYSQVWPNYRDVVAAMLKCAVVATDSGSMQEEMNILGVPCVTLRFGTDRGESLLAGGNVLAPPTNAEFVADIVQYATREESLRNVGNIYGENASQMLVDEVMKRLDQEWGVFVTEEQRLGL